MRVKRVRSSTAKLCASLAMLAIALASVLALVEYSTFAETTSDARIAYGDELLPLVEGDSIQIYGPGGQLITRIKPDGRKFLLTDHLASVRVSLDDTESSTHYDYTPFGAAGEGARYAGHPYDARQGIYQTPVRSYDPSAGRFLSLDPQRQGSSPYVYAGNNPVGYLDPTGAALTPFFMKTNMPSGRNASTPAIMKLFGAPGHMKATDSSSFQSRPDLPRNQRRYGLSSSVAVHLKAAMEGRRRGGRQGFERTEEFYWMIGGEQAVTVPDEFKPILARMNERRPGAASKIIILDFSSKGTGKAKQDVLEGMGMKSIVVKARMGDLIYDTSTKTYVPKGFVIDGGGGERMVGYSEFKQHVRSMISEKQWEKGLAGSKRTNTDSASGMPPSQRPALDTQATNLVGDLGPDGRGGAGPPPPPVPSETFRQDLQDLMTGNLQDLMTDTGITGETPHPDELEGVFTGFGGE